MFSASKDSPATPHPVSGLAMPASVYMTVSRSGQIWNPQRSKSSAVFTTTERFPDGSTSCKPAASFAPPTPPASATTFIAQPARSGLERPLLGGDIVIPEHFEGVGREGEGAEG